MENIRPVSVSFIIGIGVSMLILSFGAIDINITLRAFCLAVTLLLAFYFLIISGKTIMICHHIVPATYAAFTLFSICSIAWSNTFSESAFTAAKDLLYFLVFYLGFYLFQADKEFFKRKILQLAILLSIITAITVVVQLLAIPQLKKEFLYTVTGLNAHKNLLSSFLFLDLFFVILAVRKFKGAWKSFAIAAAIINLAIIGLLLTKAVWLGGIVATGLYLFLMRSVKQEVTGTSKIYLLIISILVFANLYFLFLLPSFTNFLLSYKGIGAGMIDNERLILWQKTHQVFLNHMLFGVGSGNWQVFFPSTTLSGIWRAEDLNVSFQRPHNDFLWILSENGLIGLNIFLLFIVSLSVLLVRGLKNRTVEEKFLSVLCFSFLIGYLLISHNDFPRERIEHNILLNILFAFCCFTLQENSETAIKKNSIAGNVSYVAVFIALLFVATISFLRFEGERHTREMYAARDAGNAGGLIDSGNNALSFAYTMDPTSVPIQWYLANAYISQGDQLKAKEAFEEAYRIAPFNRNVLNDLGSMYVLEKQPEKAKLYYTEASRISPRFDDPKLNLAAIFISEKKYELSDRYLRSLFHDSERRSNYQKIVKEFRE